MASSLPAAAALWSPSSRCREKGVALQRAARDRRWFCRLAVGVVVEGGELQAGEVQGKPAGNGYGIFLGCNLSALR